jgi:hypothetical protein
MLLAADSYGGGSADWAKAIARIKYSYLIELRDGGTHGFLLPPEQITPTGQETWAGVHTIATELVHKYVTSAVPPPPPTTIHTHHNMHADFLDERKRERNDDIQVDIMTDPSPQDIRAESVMSRATNHVINCTLLFSILMQFLSS